MGEILLSTEFIVPCMTLLCRNQSTILVHTVTTVLSLPGIILKYFLIGPLAFFSTVLHTALVFSTTVEPKLLFVVVRTLNCVHWYSVRVIHLDRAGSYIAAMQPFDETVTWKRP